jgi:hypothetical protein
MSVAFTREESAETAAAVELPDRPVSSHPSLVTQSGLKALEPAIAAARAAYHAAQLIEDLIGRLMRPRSLRGQALRLKSRHRVTGRRSVS